MDISDVKEMKKELRTHNNVMVLYAKDGKYNIYLKFNSWSKLYFCSCGWGGVECESIDYCIRHNFRAQIFLGFWTRPGNS